MGRASAVLLESLAHSALFYNFLPPPPHDTPSAMPFQLQKEREREKKKIKDMNSLQQTKLVIVIPGKLYIQHKQ